MTTAPWVGDPLAFGVGAIVLIAYAFAKSWTESLVTVAHEGGHMAMLALTGREHRDSSSKKARMQRMVLRIPSTAVSGSRGGYASSPATQVWWALWSAIAILCLWSGGRLLLHHR